MEESFPQCPLIHLPLSDRVADGLGKNELSVFSSFWAPNDVSFGTLMMGHIDRGRLSGDIPSLTLVSTAMRRVSRFA